MRVLVVDDQALLGRGLARMLKSAGYLAESCASGAAALIEIARWHPSLVLLDLLMPGVGGVGVCKMLTAKGIRVIGMTGGMDPLQRKAMLEAGAEVVLQKPIGSKELVEAIGLPHGKGSS